VGEFWGGRMRHGSSWHNLTPIRWPWAGVGGNCRDGQCKRRVPLTQKVCGVLAPSLKVRLICLAIAKPAPALLKRLVRAGGLTRPHFMLMPRYIQPGCQLNT